MFNEQQLKAREVACYLAENDIEIPEKLLLIGADMEFIRSALGGFPINPINLLEIINSANKLTPIIDN